MANRVPSSVGVRLQELREAAELPAREVDRLADIREGHTSLIETGVVKDVRGTTLSKLAKTFGASLHWLIDGEGEPPTDRTMRVALDVARVALKKRTGRKSKAA